MPDLCSKLMDVNSKVGSTSEFKNFLIHEHILSIEDDEKNNHAITLYQGIEKL